MTTTPVRPSRRALVHGAAWSVPVVTIAAAAPAFAASPCVTDQSFRLDWGPAAALSVNKHAGSNEHIATATATGPTGTKSVTVTFKSTTTGTVTRADNNLAVTTETNIGNLGAGERGLNIAHADGIVAGRDNRQVVTISFDRAVTGLSFSITDIDSQRTNLETRNNKPAIYSGWYDRVELTGTRTGTCPAGTVLGAGVQGVETSNTVGPWRLNNVDNNVDYSGSNVGNILVTYAGTIAANTAITLTYWSSQGGGNQRISLGDFTFTATGC